MDRVEEATIIVEETTENIGIEQSYEMCLER